MSGKIGFLGIGVMGGGLLKNIINKATPELILPNEICIHDIDIDKANTFKKYGVEVIHDLDTLIESVDFLVIGLKPQAFLELKINSLPKQPRCIISMMAGITIEKISSVFTNSESIIRIMPNLPCLIGEGTIGINTQYATKIDSQYIEKIFSVTGKIYNIEEKSFDLFTCVSGSGPAYLFYFVNSLVKAAIEMGFSSDDSINIVLNTMLGSVKYAMLSNDNLDKLVENVCSKGGTTVEAINIFEEKQFEMIIKKAMFACKDKAKAISEEL